MYCRSILKRVEPLKPFVEGTTLAKLFECNLRIVCGHLLREQFQRLWEYTNPTWPGKLLEAWCTRGLRSPLEPRRTITRRPGRGPGQGPLRGESGRGGSLAL